MLDLLLLPTLEKHTSKLPAILLLHNLGWQYLSPKQALAYRGGEGGECGVGRGVAGGVEPTFDFLSWASACVVGEGGG
ncbi:hypothetical protein [Glaesserella parasuis]|uniref:hypothetical protein n=1 Tax=Glaesserella parasuis TaxID=738 RepID=UPI0024366DBC|nr:hypothetical protein [Glaesserella parasuis]MDG6855660.1 hypothetical protein [Glaesserella parasuis]